MRRAAAWLGTLAIVLSACAPAGAPPASAPAATPEQTSAASSASAAPTRSLAGHPLSACWIGPSAAISALCGSLSVPEDPGAPDGRHIDLRVAVIPAEAREPEPDPFFLLAGGPGGAATESLPWAAGTFRGIHATRDIVLVDQRGTGGSNALFLGQPPDIEGLSEAEADAVVADWVTTRLASLDAAPRFYTTSVAMDDVDAVRSALGYEQVNLFGASYGATAAQYYVRQHQDHVRAVVLDGATLLDVPVFEGIAAASQRALDLLFDRCAADAACASAYPDVRTEFSALLETVRAEPVTTSVLNPADGEPIVIDHLTLTGAVHAALLDAQSSAALPWLIHAAAQGRWDAVATAVVGASAGSAGANVSVMSGEIRCSEAWAVYDPDEVARLGAASYYLEAQVLGARMQAAACRHAPAGIVPQGDAGPARSPVPVLLVVGEGDPQDPPGNIADAPVDFPNSVTIVVPGHGHTVAHLGCMPSIVDAFVAAGTVEGLDVSCVDQGGVPVPPFRLP